MTSVPAVLALWLLFAQPASHPAAQLVEVFLHAEDCESAVPLVQKAVPGGTVTCVKVNAHMVPVSEGGGVPTPVD